MPERCDIEIVSVVYLAPKRSNTEQCDTLLERDKRWERLHRSIGLQQEPQVACVCNADDVKVHDALSKRVVCGGELPYRFLKRKI
jgi:hypothetical protein